MAEAVLQYLGSWIEENIFDPLRSPEPVKERLAAMTDGINKLYKSGQAPYVLAVMSLGEADNLFLFHHQLEKSLKKWLNELSQVVEETGVEPEEARLRAEDSMMIIQGALVLVRVTNNIQPFKRAIGKIPQILLSD